MLIADAIKKCLAVILLAILAISMMVPTAWSRTEVRYELRSGDVIYGNDFIDAAPQETLFHQQEVHALDFESEKVSFPSSLSLSSDGRPASGSDIALPSISQRVDQSASLTNTGFYTANYCYCPGPNEGNVPLTASYIVDRNAIQPGRLIGSAPMYPEMINTAPGQRKYGQMLQQANNTTKSAANESSSDGTKSELKVNSPAENTSITDGKIMYLNSDRECPTCVGPSVTPQPINTGGAGTAVYQGANNTLMNISAPARQGYDLSYEHFNMSANTSAIDNMSVTDRMWRNSHLGGTMWTAYEGDTAAPAWIAPFDKPQTVIQMSDHIQVLKDSLNLTAPGTHIKPRFWRL
jgi:hypothetical protein